MLLELDEVHYSSYQERLQTRVSAFNWAKEQYEGRSLEDILTGAQKIERYLLTGDDKLLEASDSTDT